jgi:hypothetical protein
MWIQSMSQFITGNERINESNNELKLELFFMKQILQFPGSMVGNMYIKTKQGNKVWVDKLKVTKEELLTLDMDDDVQQWIRDKQSTYNDNDW